MLQQLKRLAPPIHHIQAPPSRLVHNKILEIRQTRRRHQPEVTALTSLVPRHPLHNKAVLHNKMVIRQQITRGKHFVY